MKIKITLAILMILSLFSCANDDMFRMGEMDTNVEVSMVLPTSAIITVTVPKDKDNILIGSSDTRISLSDKPLNSYHNFWDEVFFTFKEKLISEDNQNNVYQYWVYDLTPNTTYYVLLRTQMNNFCYNWWDFISEVYYTEEYFTTAKDGDFSGLGYMQCEVIERYSGKAYVKVTLPPNVEFSSSGYSYLVASTNPDMNDYYRSANESPSGKEYVFCFNDIPNGIYYVQFDGHLKIPNGYEDLGEGYITLNAKTTLKIAQ